MRRSDRRRRRRNTGRRVGFWFLGVVALLLVFGTLVFGTDSLRSPQEVDPVERVASPAMAQGEAPPKEKGIDEPPAVKEAKERVAQEPSTQKAAEEEAEGASAEQAVMEQYAAEKARESAPAEQAEEERVAAEQQYATEQAATEQAAAEQAAAEQYAAEQAEKRATEQAAEERVAVAEQAAEQEVVVEEEQYASGEAAEAAPLAPVVAPADTAMYLSVPKLGISGAQVVDGEAGLELGAMHLPGTGFPWIAGSNTYIAGHRVGFPGTGSDRIFYSLPSLAPGDAVMLTDSNGTVYEYRVSEVFAVTPVDTWVTAPTGSDTVTLQVCTETPEDWWTIGPRLMSSGPESGRLVVRADRVA